LHSHPRMPSPEFRSWRARLPCPRTATSEWKSNFPAA